jgi:Sugar (and other) transporter
VITPIGLKNLNYKFYIIWAVVDVAFMFIVYTFYPETARKSLEEIDLLFVEESGKEILTEDNLQVRGATEGD